MNQVAIQDETKKELEDIINELFFVKIEAKLNEMVGELSTEIYDRSNRITSKIDTVSRSIDGIKGEIIEKIEEDVEDKLEGIKFESENHNRELKKIASDGFDSIQIRLSEIENENLADILSKAVNILENQKNYSEDFLLKLEGAIKSHTENILSNNLENRESFQKSQVELQSDIVALINDNGRNQKIKIQDLSKSISDFVELENQNKLNHQKQLEFEFQKVERRNSVLIKGFEEKLELLKIENEKQVSEVARKSNLGFLSLLVINVLILIFLLLNHFLVIE
jgi:hypothetical protein